MFPVRKSHERASCNSGQEEMSFWGLVLPTANLWVSLQLCSPGPGFGEGSQLLKASFVARGNSKETPHTSHISYFTFLIHSFFKNGLLSSLPGNSGLGNSLLVIHILLLLNFTCIYLFCMCVWGAHATARVWRSEDNLRKSVLFLCVLGSAWLSDKWP